MNFDTILLEAELAAYSPVELSKLAETVGILLETSDDGSLEYCVVHARIHTMLVKATEARMAAERLAGQTATIVPFPAKPK